MEDFVWTWANRALNVLLVIAIVLIGLNIFKAPEAGFSRAVACTTARLANVSFYLKEKDCI